jgi:hypothetical protein
LHAFGVDDAASLQHSLIKNTVLNLDYFYQADRDCFSKAPKGKVLLVEKTVNTAMVTDYK